MWSAIGELLLKAMAALGLWWIGIQKGKADSDRARLEANEAARKDRDARDREVSDLPDSALRDRLSKWLRRD